MAYIHLTGHPPELGQARRLFAQFHCYPPGQVVRLTTPRAIPSVLVRLGKLKAVVYSSDRGQPGRERLFLHRLDEPPTLAANVEGDQLYILGGRYRITRRGIEG